MQRGGNGIDRLVSLTSAPPRFIEQVLQAVSKLQRTRRWLGEAVRFMRYEFDCLLE